MMAVQTVIGCGCVVDDAVYSTVHTSAQEIVDDGSPGDQGRYPEGRHYPVHGSPATFCFYCDLYRPCLCPGERMAG